MKFNLKSKTLLSRIAKRLREVIPAHSAPIPESFNFKDATAYTLGHEDLRAWCTTTEQTGEAESPWDEECTAAELEIRRLHEANRLTEYALTHGVHLARVKELIALWQPTAARPQSPTLNIDKIKELRAAGVPLQAYCLLLAYELTGEDPNPEDLDLFRNGIKSSVGVTNKALPLYIGPLAVRLVNRKTGPAAKLGVALLEMLCETPLEYAKVNLARALRNGWGVAPNLARAKSLCKFTNKKLDAGEDVFTEDVSRVDFYTLQGQLYADSTSQEDRKFAFESYQKAASYGSGPAALILVHYYLPLEPGMKPDEFSGVVPPNESMSEFYFRLAIQRGFNRITNTFPQGAI